MVKRFTETVNIQPQTVATGRVELLQSLSQKLDAFAGQTAAFATRKVVEQAQQEGVATGIAQQQAGEGLQLKEGGFIGSIPRKAFNKAAREGYLKSLDNDNIEAITRIAAENPNNLAGFNDAIESYAKGVMDNVDPVAQSAVALSLDSMVARHRPKIQAAQAQQVVDDSNQQQAINATERGRVAQSASFDGDSEQAGLSLAAAIDSINNRTDIDDERKAFEIRRVQLEEREAHFSGELSREFDTTGGQGALNKLDELAGKRPGGFTPDEWNGFISREQTKINRKIARQGLDLKAAAKETEKQAKIARGGLFLDPAIPADPAKGGADREDVNLHYDSISPEWSQLPIQEQVNLNVDFTKNTGIIPDTMISNVNASMRSGTVDQVALMSDYISRLQEEAPATLKDIPEESRAISLMVSDGVRAGIDSQESLDQARKFTFGITSAERETIAIQTQEFGKDLDKNLQSFANRDTDEGGFDVGIFSFVPDVTPAMVGEYRNSFSRFMKMTGGNPDQSEKLAFQAIKSVWGVTETGGNKRFMKYAPEVIYNIPGYGANWIEDQFNEEMEIVGAPGAILATDNTTARESQPSYPVLVPNESTGILEPLLDENSVVLRWRPDFKATEEFKAITDAPGRKIASARKQRKINTEKRAGQVRRSIQSRTLRGILNLKDRNAFMDTVEGKAKTSRSITNLLAEGRISAPEATQARSAFGVE